MIAAHVHAGLELRKRIDTRAALVGYLAAAAVILATAVLSVSIVVQAPSFGASEVVIVVGLPAALTAAVIGAVCGVGDGAGAERDGVLVGVDRTRIYAARVSACACLLAALVVFTLSVATTAIGAAVLLGGRLESFAIGPATAQVVALTMSNAVMAFGVGASVRSLPVALVTVVLVVLVADVALSFAGTWTEWVRFSSVQGGLLGESAPLPGITAGLLWVVLPVLVGLWRTKRAEA